MTRDFRDKVVVDPVLAARHVETRGVRLLRADTPLTDGDFRHEVAIALRLVGRRWPPGEYRLQVYDSLGMLMETTRLGVRKSLEPTEQHLEGSFYCADEVDRAELIFESESEIQGNPAWEELEVRLDPQAELKLSIESHGVRAQMHPDFEFNNLLLVEVSGEVRPSFGLPFPAGLMAQLSVYNEAEQLLNSQQVDLTYGPDGARPVRTNVQVYSHEEPTQVRVEFFTV